MSREIILSDHHPFVAIVDDEDYDFLVRWRWTFKRSTRKHNRAIYACRNTRTSHSGPSIKIMLHNVVMDRAGIIRPSELHTVDHVDNNSLNNQRGNLIWASAGQQNVNRRTKLCTSCYARDTGSRMRLVCEVCPSVTRA